MVDDIVQEGKSLLALEKAKILVEEAETVSEYDLRGALDMLREALEISPDFPDLEDEIYLREDAIEKLDGVLKHIQNQLEEGKTYRAYQLLQELPDNYIITDKSGTIDQLAEKVSKVEGMIEGARNLPRTGNSPALLMLQEAYDLLPDYPGLIEDIEALNNSQQNYNQYIASVEAAVEAGDIVKARDLLAKFKTVYPEDANIGRFEVAIRNQEQELRKREGTKKNLIKIACVALGVLVIGVIYYVFELTNYSSAEKKWVELQAYLKAAEYAEVKETGDALKGKLDLVKLTSQSKKKDLLAKVDDVLASETVVQGVKGNILVDGSYIPKESLSGSTEAKKIIEEAQRLLAAGKYTDSLARFKDARGVISHIDADLAARINKDIDKSIGKAKTAHIKSILAAAGSLQNNGKYDEALVEFGKARSIAQKYGFKRNDSIAKQIEKRTEKTTKSKLDSMIAEGNVLLDRAEYDSSLNAYKKALDFARLKKIDDNNLVNKLYGSINRARIYGLLAKGDENYTVSRWMDAIKYYNNAVELAVKAGLANMPILDQARINVKLAEKKITLDELKRLELAAGKLFADEEWQEAYESYRNLVAIMGNSDYSDNPEFSSILEGASKQLATVQERVFVNSRKEYLLEKYRGILRNAFGSSRETTFLNPEVTLLSSDEKVLKFSLTAKSYVKKSGDEGRYSSYSVFYAYDREKESWHLISKSSSSQ